MSDGSGQRIKVTVQWVQILDNKEPAFDDKGEFVFRSEVTSNNLPGEKHESRYPASGHISISDQPVVNRVIIKWVIFEGEVSDHLAIKLTGEELDKLTANDYLETYQREFSGPVESWLGTYGPGEDFSAEGSSEEDPEVMTDWRVNIYIDPA